MGADSRDRRRRRTTDQDLLIRHPEPGEGGFPDNGDDNAVEGAAYQQTVWRILEA